MFRYDPATGNHEQFYDGELVGGFTIQADGSLLLFMAKGAIASWRDGKLSYLVDGTAGGGGEQVQRRLRGREGPRLLRHDAE